MENNNDTKIKRLRSMRRAICFSIVDRGSFYMDTLTEAQKKELKAWRLAWLDVTKTLIVPKSPVWLNLPEIKE